MHKSFYFSSKALVLLHCLAVWLATGMVDLSIAHAAKPRVACTLPTLAALVREIGGDKIDVFSLAAGDQDPHFVSPTPSLMQRVREAELLLEIGMQLEVWADDVANGSGNPRIFRGAAGRVALAQGIAKLEVPAVVTRAEGDIHPEGNPHLWLDPVRAKLLAENIAVALKRAFAHDAAYFDSRLASFKQRIDRALFGDKLLDIVGATKLSRLAVDGRLQEFLSTSTFDGKSLATYAGGWLARAAPLRGQKAVEFHRVWVYTARLLGIDIVGTIEERPGIQPGPRHLAELSERMRRDGVRLVLVDNFYDPAVAERVARDAGAKVVLLANQVNGEKGVDDYFALVDHVVTTMLRGLAP